MQLHDMISFMNAFSVYNQILMHPNDQENTFFMLKKAFTATK